MSRLRPPRPRLLPVLILMFLLPGGYRLLTGLDAARAQSAAIPVAASAVAGPVATPELAENLIDLSQRESAIRDREAALIDRERLLSAAEARLREQIAALAQAESELAATLALAESAAETDIARLVAVFESMKPEEAAPVFTEMDPVFAAGFIGRLRPETAAAILAGMEPRDAYLLSSIVAGRNAGAPRD